MVVKSDMDIGQTTLAATSATVKTKTIRNTSLRRLNTAANLYHKLAKMNINNGKRRTTTATRQLSSRNLTNFILIATFTILWCCSATSFAQNTGMWLASSRIFI